MELGDLLIEDAQREFRGLRRRAEQAMAQIADAAFFARVDEDSNSIAILVKHVAGNLHSRWRDFLTTDGEKADRARDTEFIIEPRDTRERLMADWFRGWGTLEATLRDLTADTLLQEVSIRGEPHTVVKAINRALTHTAEHVGQIIMLARHFSGASWSTLSIPRGQSEQFNQQMQERARAPR